MRNQLRSMAIMPVVLIWTVYPLLSYGQERSGGASITFYPGDGHASSPAPSSPAPAINRDLDSVNVTDPSDIGSLSEGDTGPGPGGNTEPGVEPPQPGAGLAGRMAVGVAAGVAADLVGGSSQGTGRSRQEIDAKPTPPPVHHMKLSNGTADLILTPQPALLPDGISRFYEDWARSDLGLYRDDMARVAQQADVRSSVPQTAMETPARITSGQREVALSSASPSVAGMPRTPENVSTSNESEDDAKKKYEWGKMAIDVSTKRVNLILDIDLAKARDRVKNNTMSARQYDEYSRSVKDTQSVISGISKALAAMDLALSVKEIANEEPGKRAYLIKQKAADYASDLASEAAQKGVVAILTYIFDKPAYFFEGVVGTTSTGVGILLTPVETGTEPLETLRDNSGKYGVKEKSKALAQLAKWYDEKGPTVVPTKDMAEAMYLVDQEKKKNAPRPQ